MWAGHTGDKEFCSHMPISNRRGGVCVGVLKYILVGCESHRVEEGVKGSNSSIHNIVYIKIYLGIIKVIRAFCCYCCLHLQSMAFATHAQAATPHACLLCTEP